jgi:hypothetical protein
MARYQGLSTAFLERLNTATDKLKDDTYVAVPSPVGPLTDLACRLDALRDGRPFSSLPQPELPPAETTPPDPTSPGAMLLTRLEQLRQSLANEPADPTLEQLRRDTIKQIEAENRERERRERQRAKRQRRAEKKRIAAEKPGPANCQSRDREG